MAPVLSYHRTYSSYPAVSAIVVTSHKQLLSASVGCFGTMRVAQWTPPRTCQTKIAWKRRLFLLEG